MKSSLRKLTNALLLVGMGVALYYAGPIVHEAIRGRGPVKPLQAAPVLADSPQETAGNIYLFNSLVTLERRRSIAAKAVQVGEIEGRNVRSIGDYFQEGSGRQRRFHLRLEGQVTDQPVRLLQVSDGNFLWTDLKWGAANANDLRHVWRVDLRRLRTGLAERPADPVRPGEAAADPLNPNQWAGLGGLPMLLESLQTDFDFALPRQMKLLDEPVYAMIGFWKPAQRRALLVSQDDAADTPGLPSRMPHHVLVLLGAKDLFPYRIEYRGVNDPLSAADIPPDSRYSESSRPLLKLDYKQPQFDVQIPEDKFAYDLPQGIEWTDRTAERLEMLRRRREAALAQSKQPAPRR